MKNKFFIRSSKLPNEIQELIYQAERNADNSAPYRKATLELQARTALELSKVTSRLTLATWTLALSTVVLVFVTALN